MAAVTHRTADVSSGTGPYTSLSFTPAAGDLVVAFSVMTATLTDTVACTDSLGGTFTQITKANKAVDADRLYFWVANALATATARTVTAAQPVDVPNGGALLVATVSGMTNTGASAVRQSAITSNGAAAATPAATLASAVLTTNPTLGFCANATNPATLTPPTGWTEGGDVGYTTPLTGAEDCFRDSGFTGTTITWGAASATAYGVIVAELDAGGAVTVPKIQLVQPRGIW